MTRTQLFTEHIQTKISHRTDSSSSYSGAFHSVDIFPADKSFPLDKRFHCDKLEVMFVAVIGISDLPNVVDIGFWTQTPPMQN